MTTPNISEAAREAAMQERIDQENECGFFVQRLLDSTQADNVAEIERLKEQCTILNSLRKVSICAQASSHCLTCSDLKQWGKTIAEPKYGEFKCLECGNSYCREHAKAHFTGSKMDRLGCQSFEIATEAIATLERELTTLRTRAEAAERGFTLRGQMLDELNAKIEALESFDVAALRTRAESAERRETK